MGGNKKKALQKWYFYQLLFQALIKPPNIDYSVA